MIGVILSALWLTLRSSRLAQIGTLILAVTIGAKVWLGAHDRKVTEKAQKAVVAAIQTETKAQAAKGAAARAPASQPGSAARLRARYCGDC